MNGTIVKPNAEVRNAPEGKVVFHLDRGAPIKITKSGEVWVQFSKVIQGKARQGYLNKKHVEPVILWKGAVRVNTSLNVRSGAGTSYDVIASLKNDDKVLVLDEVHGEAVNGETKWLEIMHKDGVAFIFAKYVAKTGDANELAGTVDLVEDESWGDNDDFVNTTDDWSDLSASTTTKAPEPANEKKEEESGLWDKITSWF